MNHKNIITAVFCAVCLVIPVILFIINANPEQLPEKVYSAGEQVTVPEFLYLSEEEARAKSAEYDLKIIEKEKIHHPLIPENHILTQSPSAGAVLHRGDAVTLVLSSGYTEYVPDVSDMPKEKASEKLESLGFLVSYQERPSDLVAPDSVITQSIPADTKIRIGSEIILTVSTGRADTDHSVSEIINNYIGMDFQKAKTQLAEQHLYAVQADTVYDPDIPNGTVISQNIPAGSTVPQGTCIQMKISLGQITVHVPDCSGKNVSEARKLLEDAGLTCMLVYIPSQSAPLDTVISQDIPPDTSIAKGSKIWLTASVGKPSYVISTGGWSGNPLPSFNTEPETESESDFSPEEPVTDLYETAPEIIPELPENIETAPPEMPEIFNIPEPETEFLTESASQEYQEAPETAPF